MDFTDYKDFDKLELYVAGVLSEKEMIEITKLVNSNLKIKEEVERIEEAFIEYSSLHAPNISSQVKNNIHEIPNGTTSIINDTFNKSSNGKVRIICALGWVAFLVSAIFNFYQYQTQNSTEQKLEATQEEQQIFANELDELKSKYAITKEQFAEIRNPETKNIVLEAAGSIPNVQAIVFWNEETQNVYVDAASLPEPPEGMVYQLWRMTSLDPLTPIGAGTLDGFKDNDQKLFAAISTNESVAFAITLEPAGGSETPTLEQLYVLGAV